MTRTRLHATVWVVLVMLAPLLSGCELVGDIFKLGVWAGVLMVGLLAVLVYVAFRVVGRT